FLLAGVTASILRKKLTPAAAITGGILGGLIYAGGGYPGLLFLVLFFVIGTLATSWKKSEKTNIAGNAEHQSTRKPGQVIANAGVAAIAGGIAIIQPVFRDTALLLMAAALSS